MNFHQPAKQNKYTDAQLFKAIENNDVTMVKEIVCEGSVNLEAFCSIPPTDTAPPDSYFKQYVFGDRCYGVTPLHEATRRGHADIVEVLICAGANIHATTSCSDKEVDRDCNLLTPLHFAARSGSVRCVELLLKAGARADAMAYENQTPLHFAARSGSVRCVELLLKAGARADAMAGHNHTPLHYASKNGLIVNRLLKAGASLNARTEVLQRTPGHIAAIRNELEIAEALLEAGANVDEKDGFGGQTMLSIAAEKGHSQMVQILIRHGARVDVLDKFDESPLFKVAFNGYAEVMEILIDNGANVNFRGRFEITPLHKVVESVHLECARLLIANGAKVNVKDAFNHLPLEYAIERNNVPMVKLLVENGSQVMDSGPLNGAITSCRNEEILNIIRNAAKLRMQNSLNRQLRPSISRQNRQTGKWLNLLVIIAIIIWILKHFFPAYFDFSNFF